MRSSLRDRTRKTTIWTVPSLLFVLLLLFLVYRGHGAIEAKASVTYPRELGRVTFVVAGDVIPHPAVTQSAAAQDKAASIRPGVSSLVQDAKRRKVKIGAGKTPSDRNIVDAKRIVVVAVKIRCRQIDSAE